MRAFTCFFLGLIGFSFVSCTEQEPEPKLQKQVNPAMQAQELPWAATAQVVVPSGLYRPLYPGRDEPELAEVAGFKIDKLPVTQTQFLAFVAANPRWRRSSVVELFADSNYLSSWPDDLHHPEGQAQAPVTQVSWFAARAYARWAGQRLPSLAEWEYLAAASDEAAFGRDDPGYNQVILNWYSRPTPERLPRVGLDPANFYGVQDLHGLVWEWVDDFNSALVTGESRGDSGLERNLFCGSGSIGAADPADYAAFMRFAFRSSLQANYTVRNLGFRCAQDLDENVQ
jgi:formylglycine-generating enzyme required for sulfatase activity